MRLLLKIVWISVSAFLVFFLNALAYNPDADMRYYASELICLDGKTAHLCTAETTQSLHVFRPDGLGVALQQDMSVSYVSNSFNSVIGLVLDSRDTYREVLLKIFAVKSAIGSLLISLVVYLAHRYRHLQLVLVRLTTGMFSVPFLLQSVAGPYPAGIAILGLLLVLAVLIVIAEHPRDISNPSLLLGCWFIGALVVVTNRFDTSAFLLSMIVVFFVRQSSLSARAIGRSPLIYFLLASLLLAIAFSLLTNDVARVLLQQAMNREITVVPREVSSRSEQWVANTGLSGDLSFSLMAPITMIDNGTRAFVNSTYGPLFFESPHGILVQIGFTGLIIVLICIAWIPLGITSVSFVADAVSRFRSAATRRQRSFILVSLGLPVVIYFVVPWYVRGVWSLPYVLPIIITLALLCDTRRPLGSYAKLGFLMMFGTNLLAVTAINVRLGDAYVLGKQFPTVMIVLALIGSTAALLVVIFQLPKIPEETSIAT